MLVVQGAVIIVTAPANTSCLCIRRGTWLPALEHFNSYGRRAS